MGHFPTKDIVERLRSTTPDDCGNEILCGKAAEEIERLRSLLGRYALHVIEEEGTDFLGLIWDVSPISKIEAEQISRFIPDMEKSKRS